LPPAGRLALAVALVIFAGGSSIAHAAAPATAAAPPVASAKGSVGGANAAVNNSAGNNSVDSSAAAVTPSSAADAWGSSAVPLTAEQETRYRRLLATLRCLVCQNETLLDSDAPLAADLRAQVRARVARGESNATIKRYLTDRYGDFVLYKPPLQPNTWLLWGGPFLLALIGLIVVVIFVRRTQRQAREVRVDADALRRVLEEDR
jgi:cytochrome c-type biogenesis protein CcmH